MPTYTQNINLQKPIKNTENADIDVINQNMDLIDSAIAGVSSGGYAMAWSENKTYNYPDVVAYPDGNTYRCIGTNITIVKPTESTNWVRITFEMENFFNIDVDGGLMPSLNPNYAINWELDTDGNIMSKGEL